MFQGCTNFNQDLRRWNISNVHDMSYIFEGCVSFDVNLSPFEFKSDISDIIGIDTTMALIITTHGAYIRKSNRKVYLMDIIKYSEATPGRCAIQNVNTIWRTYNKFLTEFYKPGTMSEARFRNSIAEINKTQSENYSEDSIKKVMEGIPNISDVMVNSIRENQEVRKITPGWFGKTLGFSSEYYEKYFDFDDTISYRFIILAFSNKFIYRITKKTIEEGLVDLKTIVSSSTHPSKLKILTCIDILVANYTRSTIKCITRSGYKTFRLTNAIIRSDLYNLIESFGIKTLYEIDFSCGNLLDLDGTNKHTSVDEQDYLNARTHKFRGGLSKSRRKSRRQTRQSNNFESYRRAKSSRGLISRRKVK